MFSEQIATIITPLASPILRSVLTLETVALVHPIVDQFETLEEGLQVTPLTPEMYAEFRNVVAHALANADWETHDTYEWDQLLADTTTTGDFYLIDEFI